jgi:DNA-binding LytR/AlgR family response regulator
MKKNVKILIVEDEFVTLDLLRDYLEDIGYEVSGDAMSAEEALAVLEKGDTDLAMLDINIKGDKDGIWVAEQIRKKYKIPFIFLTAFSDAVSVEAASRTHPAGYLVKPFTKADIFTSIEIALKNYSDHTSVLKLPDTLQSVDTEVLINDAIFIKDNLVFKKIVIEDIMYVQAFKNYLELHMADSRQIIRSTLTDFQKILPKDHFIQTHRSFVINMKYMQKIGSDFVQIGSTDIPLSKGHKEDVLKRLKFYY